jgi:hypothetical protein
MTTLEKLNQMGGDLVKRFGHENPAVIQWYLDVPYRTFEQNAAAYWKLMNEGTEVEDE